jgi:tRNA pseudouridine55 synthase
LVDKPAGQTSHDVVQTLRRGLRQRQVGHTGTLDPAATGLMVVTLGRATRVGRFLEATDKAYEGVVQLGRSTTTWDAEGDTQASAEVALPLDRARVEAVLRELTGEVEQVVPAFSAVKVDGERLHARARRGEVIEGPRRAVRIHRLELLDIVGPDLELRCEVEKGTYIRSLAVEIGRRLGYPAHLKRLRRTRVGPHGVEGAQPPERFSAPAPPVVAPVDALAHLPRRELSPREARQVAHGHAVDLPEPGWARLVGPSGRLVAVAQGPERPGARATLEVVLIRPEELEGTV